MLDRSVPDSCAAVDGLLRAIESRDLRAIGRRLALDANWQVVPHPPARGRDGVVGYLAGIVTWSDEVRWDVVSAQYDDGRAWVERVDRFRLDGHWYDVCCNGVFDVDASGLVTEVRDYVDLGEWRARVRPVLEHLAARPPVDVVRRHVAAVHGGDPIAMAADYALDAVLVRGSEVHSGWGEIADYFDGVPGRLGGRTVTFGEVEVTPTGPVRCRWSIEETGDHRGVTGVDTFVVSQGRIVRQTVELDGDDF